MPLLDGLKNEVGKAEVLKIVAARPENMDMDLIKSCGFKTIDEAIDYVKSEHGEEFVRDGVMTIYVYRVTNLNR